MFISLGLLVSAGPISAKTTLQATDFESFPVGAGTLSPTFTTIVAGPSSVAIGAFAPNDPVQGVVASSVLGTGQAAYLGGAGTGVVLDTSPTFLAAEVFFGVPAANALTTVQLAGSATAVTTVAMDLAVHRTNPENQQSFSINYYDAQFADGSGFAVHSAVKIGADNTVFIQDNQNSPFIDTGVVLLSDSAYHLQITVDYNAASWSSSLTGMGNIAVLASGRSINVAGFTLSGFTTPTNGIANINMLAASIDVKHPYLADRLLFDNLETYAPTSLTPVPESSTMGILGALLLGSVIGWRRRRKAG